MGLLLALVVAQPFVRTMANGGENAACLWWPISGIEFRQSTQGNPATGTASLTAVANAFITWNDAMKCSTLQLAEGAKVATRRTGATPQGPNVNLVLFRTRSCTKVVAATHACWKDGSCGNTFDCWDQSSALLATTIVSFDSVTGQIFDADIEFNAADHVFTAVDTPTCIDGAVSQRCVATDIQNTATHEVGHFLGLGHTAAHGSTMNDTSTMGERSKRSLDEGTRSFLCEVYSPELGPDDCVLPPVSETLGATPTKGCATSPSWPILLLALPLLFRRRWALAAGLSFATVSQAATVEALELPELARRADRIAWAKVESLDARWTSDGARIVTDVSLRVTETWKGRQDERIDVLVPGGVVGRVGQRMAGAPELHVGQELVVFLEASGDRSIVLGLSRGLFMVDRSRGAAVVSQPSSSVRSIDERTGKEHPLVFAPMELAAFRAQILSQVQGADSKRALPTALPTQISR